LLFALKSYRAKTLNAASGVAAWNAVLQMIEDPPIIPRQVGGQSR
jgi:hypothetical protein